VKRIFLGKVTEGWFGFLLELSRSQEVLDLHVRIKWLFQKHRGKWLCWLWRYCVSESFVICPSLLFLCSKQDGVQFFRIWDRLKVPTFLLSTYNPVYFAINATRRVQIAVLLGFAERLDKVCLRLRFERGVGSHPDFELAWMGLLVACLARWVSIRVVQKTRHSEERLRRVCLSEIVHLEIANAILSTLLVYCTI